MLKVGDRIPEVEVVDAGGQQVRLGAIAPGKTRVIYFYPKDDTPVCTAQACGFRDAYQDFVEAGAEVIGISDDPPADHQRFATKHALPFTLVSDPGGRARKAFGVKATLGVLPGRTTFVVDEEGAVRLHFTSALRAGAHVREALEAVRSISSER